MLTNMNKYLIGIIVVAVFGLGFLFYGSVFGEVSKDMQTPSAVYQNYNFFASTTSQTNYATTTSATSTNITPYWTTDGRKDNGYLVIAGAEKVTFYFQRGDTSGQGNSGSSTFKVQVSNDGTNWYDYGNLNSATSSSPTALSQYVISAATSTVPLSLDLTNDSFYAVRCIVVETTDGEHSCRASASW